MPRTPSVSICVLTYGDYPQLAKRVLGSIQEHCQPKDTYDFEVIVGANSVSEPTRDYLTSLLEDGLVHHLIDSPVNLNQCPMMRQMISKASGDYIWWFDDDSYITEPDALYRRIIIAENALEHTVMWGHKGHCDRKMGFTQLNDPVQFVRSASWYRGLPPPSWKVGGKGEFDFRSQGTGDGRWIFIAGGEWFMRTTALHELNWPDPRILRFGSDVFLGEAIRQQGWRTEHIGPLGVMINTELRRGSVG